MADKEFPPSELRIQRLRHEGIVPFSRDLSFFFCWLAVAVLVSLFHRWYAASESVLRSSLLSSFVLPSDPNRFLTISRSDLVVVCAVVAAVVLVLVLLGGLLQNRFLLTTGRLGSGWSIVSLGAFAGVGKRIVFVVLRLALACLLCVLTVLFLNAISADYFSEFGSEELELPSAEHLERPAESEVVTSSRISQLLVMRLESRRAKMFSYIEKILWGGVLLFGIFGVIARIAVVQLFRMQYSMSREEIEAEQRETEPSPEIRERQRERD